MSRRSRRLIGGLPWYAGVGLKLNNVSPVYASEFVNERYYASTTGVRSYPYTFTRAGNTTMIDSNGRMINAPANMLTHGYFHGASWSTSGVGSSITATSITDPVGRVFSKLVAGNTLTLNANDSIGAVRLSSAVTIITNATYCFSFYAAAAELSVLRVRESVSTGFRATIDLTTGIVTTESGTATLTGGMVVTTEAAGTGIWRIICKRTVNTTSFNIDVKQGNTTGDGTSGVYVSSPMLELDDPACPKAFVYSDGAALYLPAFDYNPKTLAPRGQQSFRAATNLCPVSGEGSSLITGVTGGAKADSAAVFFGRVGTRFTAGGTTSPMFVPFGTLASAPAASTQHTTSCFVRAGTRTKCQLTVSANFAAVDVYANFDLTNGTVLASGAGAVTPTIEDWGNGVWRIWFSFTTSAVPATGAGALVAFIQTDTSTRIASITGNTDTIDVFGGQLETGPGPSVYIPTFSVSASRVTDNTIETLGAWYDANKGTLYSEVEILNQGSSSFPNAVWIHGGSSSDRISQYYNRSTGAGTLEVRAAGVTSATIAVAGSLTGISKMVSLYDTTGTRSQNVRGGTAGTEDTTTTVPTVTTMSVGQNAAATEAMGGWVRKLYYWADASSSDAQRQAFTA